MSQITQLARNRAGVPDQGQHLPMPLRHCIRHGRCPTPHSWTGTGQSAGCRAGKLGVCPLHCFLENDLGPAPNGLAWVPHLSVGDLNKACSGSPEVDTGPSQSFIIPSRGSLGPARSRTPSRSPNIQPHTLLLAGPPVPWWFPVPAERKTWREHFFPSPPWSLPAFALCACSVSFLFSSAALCLTFGGCPTFLESPYQRITHWEV